MCKYWAKIPNKVVSQIHVKNGELYIIIGLQAKYYVLKFFSLSG